MAFIPSGPRPWTVPPVWNRPVRESLGWRSGLLRANVTGVSYHDARRDSPARAFEFELLDERKAWRVADELLNTCSGRDFLLPIWPDVQHLGAQSAGATTIGCDTTGRDFVANGQALLWGGVNQWELLDVDSVFPGQLALSTALAADWAAGVRLYPLRRARARNALQETVRADDKGRRTLRFDIREPCDWPATLPTATYLTHAVLERRPNDGADENGSYNRLLAEVANEVNDPAVFDLAGIQLRGQSFGWRLWGEAEHTDFRSLLYGLRGATAPVWVPTWKQDLQLVDTLGAASQLMEVEWTGYTALEARQPNRRDLRIELNDGTTFYRRITDSIENGDSETMVLDSALGESIAPDAVRAISYLVLSTAGDHAEIDHMADITGEARVSMTFSAVVPDV